MGLPMPARPRFNFKPETVDAVPLWINLFGPCSSIGRALGLEVDLPDLTDRSETAALWRLPSNSWKDPLEGRVADTMRNGDDGWLRLMDFTFATAYFDLEEGVKFHTDVASLKECLAFIAALTNKGVRLWDVNYMEGHGGEFGGCVWVTPAVAGPVPDVAPILEEIGLVPGRPDRLPPWTMPPGWTATDRMGR